ncbi:hypothetical protein KUTeg_001084 [Tegillarca granosa]|uniref:Uncharacterized protein n=1 Tax=Tegillarca granosa TaxID=220873 RepID=A0ABQ9G088_TEGGR|nr:hypothetical protein KUTeg_001084 [Tegillarca granosa]
MIVLESTWTLTGSSEFAVAGESFTLICNPPDSNAIAVKWKRLDIDTTATGTCRASVEANGCRIDNKSDTQYQYTCEPGPVYKLTIPANVMTNSQNNKVWRCESVFGGSGDKYTLRVAGINITIRGSSQYVVPGRPFTFTCVFNSGGTLSKQLLQDGELFEAVQLSNDGSGVCYNVTSAVTICDPSRCFCSEQGDIFTAKWTISSIDAEYTWKCKEFNDLSPTLYLKVAVPVSSVTLYQVTGSQVDVIAGQNISLTCVAGQSRPRSYIQWYVGTDNYTINSTSSVTNGQDELTSVTSILTFTVTRKQANLAVNCKAYNIDPNTIVELVNKPKLNVQYRLQPKAEIKDVGDSLSVTDGSFVTLHCEVEGGSPLAVISWSCFCGKVTNASEAGISRSIITFTASSSLNGKICMCSATHPASVIQNDSVQIMVTSKPQPPRYLEIFDTKHNSIVLKWERGSKSNFQHQYVILVQNMVSHELRKYLINDDLKKTNYSFEIENLLPSTSYKFQLYSMNENGNSSFLSVLASVTSESKGNKQNSYEKPKGTTKFKDISKNDTETKDYENMHTGHKNQSKRHGGLQSETTAENQHTYQTIEHTKISDHGYENKTIRDIDTYESLQPGAVIDNQSTYQKLKKKKTGNDDIPMDVYVKTRHDS